MTILFLGALLAASTPEVPVLECRDLPPILQMLERGHYARDQVEKVAEKRSIKQFIKSLDPSKNLLLKKDVARLQTELPRLFRTMARGDCAVLSSASQLVIKRAQEDERIVKALLDGDYKLDENVELQLDPDERGYAKSDRERAARVRRLVHFQISNFLLAGLSLDEAKKKVIHRYELATKRVARRRQDSELPGMYAEAYASALDPHSSFLSAETLADFQIHMRLSLEGIGAVLRSEDGFTVIQSLVPGGQADKQGELRPKDKITAVAQEGEAPVDVIDMDLRDVVGMIRGPKGTKVTLTVLREGKETKSFDVVIVRDKIDVKEQAAKITYETRKLGKKKSMKIGIIELPSFYGGDRNGRSAYKDMMRLLGEAREQDVDGIVLDLSKNGGGLLEDAVRISGLFIKRGGVVATKSFDGEIEVLEDDDSAVVYTGPLVVLTSPVSASASEILAGALKDYHRAVIVGGGPNTFGKGTVQKLQPLPRGLGALKITTGMFFVPSGSSTQQIGVASDVVVPSVFGSYDMGEKSLDYSLPPQAIPPFLSKDVNGDGDASWKPVSPMVLNKLRKYSKKRTAKDPVMKEIVKEVSEAKKKKKKVKLADLRREAEADKKKDGDDKKKKDEDKEEDSDFDRFQKAFVQEGVNVLIDLVRLTS